MIQTFTLCGFQKNCGVLRFHFGILVVKSQDIKDTDLMATKKKNNDPREGRYFTRVKDGKVGVWGLESWYASDTLFVTEGVFDACRVTALGYSAVAVLSFAVGPTTSQWLKLCRAQRPVVVVCDNDPSGLKLKKYGHEYHVVETGDLGDASEQYVINLLEKYS